MYSSCLPDPSSPLERTFRNFLRCKSDPHDQDSGSLAHAFAPSDATAAAPVPPADGVLGMDVHGVCVSMCGCVGGRRSCVRVCVCVFEREREKEREREREGERGRGNDKDMLCYVHERYRERE